MKPNIKQCKDLIKKHKQILEKEAQIEEQRQKFFKQQLEDSRTGIHNHKLLNHISDDTSVMINSLKVLNKEFNLLMEEFEKVVNQKE